MSFRLPFSATIPSTTNPLRLRFNFRLATSFTSAFSPSNYANKIWRNYIRIDNPIAAALLSKMGYTESERIELKKQFLRMLVRLELDEAKQRLLMAFLKHM